MRTKSTNKPGTSTGRLILTCLIALAAIAIAPAAASASSVVYIKDGNVWLTSGDGTSTRQVTTGGNWHSPTQADDGTIAAVQGADAPITVMNGYGQVLRTVATPSGAAISNGGTFAARPVNLDFSPDGSKIAYEYASSSCPVASSCGARNSTFYTYSDRATPVSEFGNQFNIGEPSFVSNSRALAFGGAGRHVNLDDLGGGDSSASLWFNDGDNLDLGDGELSRQNDRFVTLRDYGDDLFVQIYGVTSGNPATDDPGPLPGPVRACDTNADASWDDPSWSPDGRQLAIAQSAGIAFIDLPTVASGDCPGAAFLDSRLIAGGSQPDWGPANVPVGNPPPDPDPDPDLDDPRNPASAACEKAKGKLAKAKAKLKKAKKGDDADKVEKAKKKVKSAKEAAKKACK